MTKILFWMDLPLILGFGAFIVAQRQWNFRYLVGLGLALGGFTLWGLARIQLGKSFSVRAEARALVTTGLYSRFRHPVYLFGGLTYAGLFLAWGKLIPGLCFALIYPTYQTLRSKKEDAVLEQAFGEEYRRYRAGTWL
ncbi:MAG: isoprenylcysteine carboxylmethyltransferase family protein [Terriglobia bacterium]|jgi:protein-S-isoprenylcysteine O-methyltransferase Ste14